MAISTSRPRRRLWRPLGLTVVVLFVLAVWVATRGGDRPTPAPAPGPAEQPTPPASPPGRVLWGSDFEDGNLGVYARDFREGAGQDATVEVSTDQARTGRRSVKLVLPPATSRGTVARLQLVADMPDAESGRERWYGISMFLADDWALDQLDQNREFFLGTIGFRYTGTDDNGPGTGNIGARRVNGVPMFKTETNLGYRAAGDSLLGPIEENRWIDFIIHIKWSMGDDGFRETWRDGVKAERYDGPTLGLDSPFEHRMGVYEGTGVDHTRTLYWDNHRVGTSYAAVDPGR